MANAARWTCRRCGQQLAVLLPRGTLRFYPHACQALYALKNGAHIIRCVCGSRVLLRGQNAALEPADVAMALGDR